MTGLRVVTAALRVARTHEREETTVTLETPRREGQRERLRAAEIATFAHHGVEATSEALPLASIGGPRTPRSN